jgi:hypothetical protein
MPAQTRAGIPGDKVMLLPPPPKPTDSGQKKEKWEKKKIGRKKKSRYRFYKYCLSVSRVYPFKY